MLHSPALALTHRRLHLRCYFLALAYITSKHRRLGLLQFNVGAAGLRQWHWFGTTIREAFQFCNLALSQSGVLKERWPSKNRPPPADLSIFMSNINFVALGLSADSARWLHHILRKLSSEPPPSCSTSLGLTLTILASVRALCPLSLPSLGQLELDLVRNFSSHQHCLDFATTSPDAVHLIGRPHV